MKNSRRDFLTTATLVAGGTVLAAPAAATTAAKPAQRKSQPARGYQKTDHVRRYYQLARQL